MPSTTCSSFLRMHNDNKKSKFGIDGPLGKLLVASSLVWLLAGCASTQISMHAAGTKPPLRIEELGPVLTFNVSPVLVAGATEVVFRTRVLDAASSTLVADVTTHWKNGGPYYVKGVKTLEQDFQDALSAVFLHKVDTVSRVF